jgi:hypothetical protein
MLWFTRARIPLPARTRATAVQPTRRHRGTRSCSLPPDSSGAQLAMGRACRQNRTSRGPHRRPTLLRRRDLRPELQKSRQSQAGHPTVRRSSSTSSPSRLAGTSTPSTRTEADSARLRTEATPKPGLGHRPVGRIDNAVELTDRDITTRVVAEAADPKMTSVGDVYSRDLISVEPDKDLEEALQLMARHQSAAARCRERQARRHRCPGRHRPQGEREEDR